MPVRLGIDVALCHFIDGRMDGRMDGGSLTDGLIDCRSEQSSEWSPQAADEGPVC